MGSFSGDGSGLTGVSAASLASGVVSVGRGGTGAGTAPGARATLGAAASGANSDITSLSGLSTPLSISQGGSGASTAANALVNLSAASLTGTNTLSGVNLLTHMANLFAGSFSGDGSALVGLNAGNLGSGVVPLARGGTAAGTASGAGATLGAAASGANSDITALSALGRPLSVSEGGTGGAEGSTAELRLRVASVTGWQSV